MHFSPAKKDFGRVHAVADIHETFFLFWGVLLLFRDAKIVG